jgi:hypothetical protein
MREVARTGLVEQLLALWDDLFPCAPDLSLQFFTLKPFLAVEALLPRPAETQQCFVAAFTGTLCLRSSDNSVSDQH